MAVAGWRALEPVYIPQEAVDLLAALPLTLLSDCRSPGNPVQSQEEISDLEDVAIAQCVRPKRRSLH